MEIGHTTGAEVEATAAEAWAEGAEKKLVIAFAPPTGASEKSEAESASLTQGSVSVAGSRRNTARAEVVIADAEGPSYRDMFGCTRSCSYVWSYVWS